MYTNLLLNLFSPHYFCPRLLYFSALVMNPSHPSARLNSIELIGMLPVDVRSEMYGGSFTFDIVYSANPTTLPSFLEKRVPRSKYEDEEYRTLHSYGKSYKKSEWERRFQFQCLCHVSLFILKTTQNKCIFFLLTYINKYFETSFLPHNTLFPLYYKMYYKMYTFFFFIFEIVPKNKMFCFY